MLRPVHGIQDHPIALEPEGSAPVTAVGYDTLNWGEGTANFYGPLHHF